jgi:SAM-dependent methyltransferase
MLEIGCGTGFVLAGLRQRFPALRLVGGEPSAAGLQIARSRLPGVELRQLVGHRLPFDREFDVVGCFDVLEHVDDDVRVLAEMRRASAPGGGVLVSVPQHPRLWSAVDEFSEHRRRYTARELRGKLATAGFEVMRTTSFVSLLLPLVALSRLRARGPGETYDPRTEYRLPRWLDAALERVMAVERALMRRGVSFPAGSSLLAVARRRD